MSLAASPWRNLIVLSATIFFTLTGLFSWTRLTALYLRDLGATEVQIGWAFLVLSFAHRVPQLLGGYLADRFGRKRLVVIGTTCMAICYAGIGLAPSWRLAVLCNLVCWIFGAMQWPGMLLLVTEPVPEHQRGRAAAILEAVSWCGVAAGFLVGWAVLKRLPLLDGGWRALCLLTTACYLIAALGRGLGLVEVMKQPATRSFLHQMRTISWSVILVPTMAMILATAPYSVLNDSGVQVMFLEDVAGYAKPDINLLSFYAATLAIVVAFAGGWLADRFGSRRMIAMACLGWCVLLWPFLRGDPGLVAWAPYLFVAMTVPAELFTVAWHKLITSIAPESSRALHVSATGMLGGLTLPWLSPLATSLYQSSAGRPFALALACAGAGLLLSLCVAYKRPV